MSNHFRKGKYMPISKLDLDFMKEVAEYFRETKTALEPDGSIRDTALHFNINRNKVRKILITMKEITSPITDKAIEMRKQRKSIKDIAKYFGVSVATVSTALPYEDKFENSAEPSKHAVDLRNYRAYEKKQMKRQSELKSKYVQEINDNTKSNVINIEDSKEWQKDIKMSYTEAYNRPHRKTWEELEALDDSFIDSLSEEEKNSFNLYRKEFDDIVADFEKKEQEYERLSNKKSLTKKEQKKLDILCVELGYYPGALNIRNEKILEEIAGNRMPPEPFGVLRLHLELYSEYPDDHTAEVLHRHGSLVYGENISRDIIVPSDIPLYALHYAIQRAFGWENSHLRMFELPEDRFNVLCENASLWTYLTGVVFRSPYMYEEDEFWADDYNGGSFKNWLRKKYTGPYMSQCQGEGIVSCRRDAMSIDMGEEYYIVYATSYNFDTGNYDGEEYIYGVYQVFDYKGNRRSEPKPWDDKVPYRVEIVRFKDIPAEGLKYVFERTPMSLLERLPISSILASGFNELPDNCSEEERNHIDAQIVSSGEELSEQVDDFINKILSEDIDSPAIQPIPLPITDVLLYKYDFGDGWKIRITASENCPDLVNSGRITQAELDRANVKCREVYRPVLIARDGEMLVDDVGGLSGFAEFLEDINPDLTGMTTEEKEAAKQRKKEMLTWAKSLGWHREKVKDFNLL